jgi:hypothetical protein
MGARSLKYQQTADGIQMITGVVDWGKVTVSNGDEWRNCAASKNKNCNGSPQAGTLMADKYADEMAAADAGLGQSLSPFIAGSNDSVKTELASVAGEIERVTRLIEGDQKIDWCVNGRDLGQITGGKQTTEARFPLLMQLPRRIIAEAALARAVSNQNARIQSLVAKAISEADEKNAEYLCYARPLTIVGRNVPESGSSAAGSENRRSIIVVGRGATNSEIAALAGTHTVRLDDILTKEIRATYTRDNRNCRICVIDKFRGKRRYVDPRAGQAEELKKAIAEHEKSQKDLKTGVVGTALGTAALATAAITGVGIAAAITTATAATAAAAAGMTVAAATTAAATLAATGAATVVATGTGAAVGSALATAGTAAAVSAAVPVVGWIAAGAIAAGIGVTAAFMGSFKSNDPMDDIVEKNVDYCIDETIGANGAE